MRHSLLGGSLLALVAGCNTAPGDSYQVYIDPAFTTDQQQAILQACQEWEDNVPVHLQVSISECSGKHNRQICLHSNPSTSVDFLGQTHVSEGVAGDTRGDTSGLGGTDGGEIELYVNLITSHQAQLSQVAEHEIAHAMGLSHHVGAFLMNPEYGYPLSCDDVQQWYYVRGQRGFCSLTP